LDGTSQEAKLSLQNIEDICKIFKKHDVSFFVGDGLRPGCIAMRATKRSSRVESARRADGKAWEHDVQVMIEGPGHVR